MATFKGDDFKFPDEVKVSDMNAEEKFEIEIEDDTPKEDRNRKPAPPPEDPTDDELSSYDEKVQARIKKFTRGYHDERRAKEEALRERQAAEDFAKQVFEENKRLQKQLSSGSEVFIEQNKTSAQAELEAAERSYKEAYEAGDPDLLAAAQTKIAKAALKLDKAENMKPIQMEEKEFETPQRQAPEQKLPPRTAKWIEANSDWWGKDEEMTAAASGLDRKLQREYGADFIGSKEYFETIDKTMRKRFPEHFEDAQSDEDDLPPKKSEPEEEFVQIRATKPASVVAPATRSTPPTRIRLKQSEVAIARRLGVTPEQYAKQVALLKRG
jgi:multidrug efflux pump subunit AcrA (membrane-fusion protein)